MLVDWILAFTPILVILFLMIRFQWGAAKAGPAGWLVAVVVAAGRFGAGVELLALAQVKALLLTVDVLLIIWAAFLLYRVADEAGAIAIIGEALPQLTADRGMQALLIGWAFASFLQGVGGFGVPVAITAPLLVGLGFSPLVAVLIPSIGHAWAVTFGSLASSFQALIAATGLPGETLAPMSATLLGLAGFGCGFMVAHAADGWGALRRLALPVLLLGTVMGVVQYGLATNGLWNIGGFGGGMVGLAVGILITPWYRGERSQGSESGLKRRSVMLAFSGYLALIAITLVIQLIPPVRAFLGQFAIRVSFPEMRTSLGFLTPAGYGRVIPLFRHAGAILGYASLIAYLIYKRAGMYRVGAAQRIVSGTIRRVMSSSLGIAAMVAMAVVMSHSGMTDTLARGLADAVGSFFPLASPWIGALGAFMTGSNTNSNVIFAMLQKRTAELLGYGLPLILGAQTTGGAIGSVVAPTKIIVGASTAGMAGREGTVLRSLLVYIAILIAGVTLLVFAFTKVGMG
ncbi:MAG: L-lactate permease [Anaerolineaceae bacterium]|nr:MAG: L-lactate permease [Anaerolineaceae bacterium]